MPASAASRVPGLAFFTEQAAGRLFRTAIDISEEAVSLSTRNAEKLGLSSVYDASLRSASELAGAFDFIVSNPPYIPSQDLEGLDAEVSDFEDPRALDGGADGLDVARQLCGAGALGIAGGSQERVARIG